MATRSSQKLSLITFLSILLVCSSGLISPGDNEHKRRIQSEEKLNLHLSHRELLNRFHYKAIKHDMVYPSTPLSNPVTTPSFSSPTDDPAAPGVVSIPSTYPGIASPSNPAAMPGSVPTVNSPLPVTNPVTTPSTYPGAQPVTNPATNPIPSGGVPVANPGTIPTVPPATTNAPAVPGQSWCVARSGTPEAALQAALDYSCGIGGADCSAIQDGGSCYNPNSPENHASYAFNSYYQKNPVQTSCDFGGAAMITNVNPSSGSCIYPASSSALPSPVMGNPTPGSPTPPTETSSGPAGTAIPGAGTPPPFLLNTSNPAAGGAITGFPDSPPSYNNSTSKSSPLRQPFLGYILLVTSIITARHILNI